MEPVTSILDSEYNNTTTIRTFDSSDTNNVSSPPKHNSTEYKTSKNLIPQIYCATHNINGLSQDITKLYHLLDYCNQHRIDIIAVTETNISKKAAAFILVEPYKYKGFWAEADNKIKGSGLGVLVATHLEQFISKVDYTSIPHYGIIITFTFKGCTITVINIYCPPSDVTTHFKITEVIQQHTRTTRKQHRHFTIIQGDFNSIIDPSLDRKGNTRFYKKANVVMQCIQRYLYIDAYRILHPDCKQYTWSTHRGDLGI